MAFAVKAWCGFNVAAHLGGQEPHLLCVELFSKLGGQYLGQVYVDKKKTLVELVRDLQRQAFKLCVHPCRTSNYLVFFVKNDKLPSFTYDRHIDKELEHAAFDSLLLLAAMPRMECMYEEDDTDALNTLDSLNQPYNYDLPNGRHGVILNATNGLFPEVGVLSFTHTFEEVEVCSDVWFEGRSFQFNDENTSPHTLSWLGYRWLDCSVLSNFSHLKHLKFGPGIIIPCWKFVASLDIKSVTLGVAAFNQLDFACLTRLETLCILTKEEQSSRDPPTLDRCLCSNVPKSLKTVYLPEPTNQDTTASIGSFPSEVQIIFSEMPFS
jgi:hypothetical protein